MINHSVTSLIAYSQISQQTYLEPNPETGEDLGSESVSGENGSSYNEIAKQINGPLGFQARAFFNATTNELVISFSGTEGFSGFDLPEFLPDAAAGLALAATGASVQGLAAQAFITQANLAALQEVGPFGSFDVTYVGHSLGGFLAQTASANPGASEGDVGQSVGRCAGCGGCT